MPGVEHTMACGYVLKEQHLTYPCQGVMKDRSVQVTLKYCFDTTPKTIAEGWDTYKSPEPEESQWGPQPEKNGTSKKVPVEIPGWGSLIMMSRAPSPELW
jgi:hypothetical protein